MCMSAAFFLTILSLSSSDIDHPFGRPIILMNTIAKLLRANRIKKGLSSLSVNKWAHVHA
jgi:hypothetical protein